MSSTRAVSINDEMIASPRLRKDQKQKIRTLVRTNSETPIIALGLVKDMLKGYSCTVILNEEADQIEVTSQDMDNSMYTTYYFPFHAYTIIETPTL
jgi:hypothetical protein